MDTMQQRSVHRDSLSVDDKLSRPLSSARFGEEKSDAAAVENRPKGQRVHPPRDVLNRRRYVDLDAYIPDFRSNKYGDMRPGDRVKEFGCQTLPIFVPLARGETSEQFEDKFKTYLLNYSNMTLAQLERHPDIHMERRIRCRYTQMIVREEIRRRADRPTKRTRDGNDVSDSPQRKKRVARSESTSSMSEPDEETAGNQCTLRVPAKDAPIKSILAAYVSCGCRQCLLKSIERLGDKVISLEEQVTRGSKSIDRQHRSVADLTRDDVSPTSGPITRLRPSPAELIEQLSSLLSSPTPHQLPFDPVKDTLLRAYDEVNERVVMNECMLAQSAERMVKSNVLDVHKAAQLQQENAEMQQLIQSEVENRSTALAMLVVHMWRQDLGDLERMLNDPTTSDSAYIHRRSHHRCATLATTAVERKENVAKIQKQLDSVATNEPSDVKRRELMTSLSASLSKAEASLQELEEARRRELTTIIHFDQRVRFLAEALLAGVK